MRISKLKVAIAATAVASGFYFGLMPFIFPRSIEAIANARVSNVRATIDGRYVRPEFESGKDVSKGDLIGNITNDHTSDDLLVELLNSKATINATIVATQKHIEQLERRRTDLEQLVELSRQNLVDRLRTSSDEQAIRVNAAEVDYEILEKEAGRMHSLGMMNVAATAKVEETRLKANSAKLHVEAERTRSIFLSRQLQAAQKGLIIDVDGALTQTRIRLDEVKEKLLLLNADSSILPFRLNEVEASIARESRRIDRVQNAAITTPINGQIWQVYANNDEYVKEGQPLVEVVDCSSIVVTATVSERTFDRLEIGQAIEFRPEASDLDLIGHVVQMHGPSSRVDAVGYAIRPAAIDTNEFRIVAELDGEKTAFAGSCPVGRTGKMFFKPHSFISAELVIHAIFDGIINYTHRSGETTASQPATVIPVNSGSQIRNSSNLAELKQSTQPR